MGVAAHPGLGQVQPSQRAQEPVRHHHVDARLGVGVHPLADPRRDRGVEVGHLHLHVRGDAVLVVDRRAADVDLQVTVDAAAGARDQDSALDPPAHDPAVLVHLVLGSAEAEQHQRPRQQHHVALVVGVLHAHQAQRPAGEEAPVRAGQALQVHRRPDRVERLAGQCQVGGLHRPHRAGVVHGGVVLGVHDRRRGHVASSPAAAGQHQGSGQHQRQGGDPDGQQVATDLSRTVERFVTTAVKRAPAFQVSSRGAAMNGG